MSLKELTIDTLGDLDSGMARAVANLSIKKMMEDAEDRGDDEKPRKVVITVTALKISDQQISVSFSCQLKLPALQPKATVGKIVFREGEPAVLFQTMSPENPDQNTFPEFEGAEKEERE